jgi:transposase-like protein
MQGTSGSSRWTTDDWIRIAMESLTTNITLAELCRKYNLKPKSLFLVICL